MAKATPVLSWANPAFIQYGTALSATQLNASANVAGTFAYSPAAGTVLPRRHAYAVSDFTPADAANYTPAPLSRPHDVISTRPLTLQVDNTSKVYGEALPAFTTTGTGFVNGDTLASLGGTPASRRRHRDQRARHLCGLTVRRVINQLQPHRCSGHVDGDEGIDVADLDDDAESVEQQSAGPTACGGLGGRAWCGHCDGHVEFRENGTLLGTATLVNGIATMNKSFKRGTHPLTATYAGNTNFNGSSGSVTHQTQ